MNVIWLDSIDSTNSEALRRFPDLPSMTVIAAREQTEGRGQRGNSWFSQPGMNLTFSIVLKFSPGQLSCADAHWLNYLVSDAVSQFLDGCGVQSSIKWPNDIYVGKRKICGMLLENTLAGASLAGSVIGIGLNINQKEFPQLSNATSLCCCTGKESPLEDCLEKLLGHFQDALAALYDPRGRESLFERYSSRLFRKGVPAMYHDYLTEREYRGVIRGVAPDGRLCVLDLDSPSTHINLYRFKEVGYII